ncbi:hypothetical protein BDA96_09G235800 [Sorghum bicolor]|uniref:Uncharacterized protein n=2 Tax=Sorghum bicolor TaxID=4558 RepID=A0A921QC99_SORBI|nr:hypothetical protein BDA96_09G235800 [Sorghum bicolor]KXG22493.1 hypothetical protein SORBI_3009G223000 [Sorghum bicolor]
MVQPFCTLAPHLVEHLPTRSPNSRYFAQPLLPQIPHGFSAPPTSRQIRCTSSLPPSNPSKALWPPLAIGFQIYHVEFFEIQT